MNKKGKLLKEIEKIMWHYSDNYSALTDEDEELDWVIPYDDESNFKNDIISTFYKAFHDPVGWEIVKESREDKKGERCGS